MREYQQIREQLRSELRGVLGDRVYFSANAPQGWLQLSRVHALLHELITALSTQLQIEAAGVEAQGNRADAERLRRRAAALGEMRLGWHDAGRQQQLWNLVWRDSAW